MARESLVIMTYVDGKNDIPFPSKEEQIAITEYTYTSIRMGSVNLSAKLMHHKCLDKLWTGLQYVTFRGEKYFIKATPSSGKDNEDARYEHTLAFISERDLKLNNVYFYDAVSKESTGDDKYKSNSTNVVFFGTIEEFVARLNESLKYSGLDYTVVIDEGITSEAKLMSFEDQFFFNVLQEIYNTYELPFYFVGKVIHIGFTSNAITQTFKYGFDNELLSIKKNNANYRIINRCTGTGSEDNIPYYYPNSSPKGDITAEAGAANAGIQQEDISIVDYEKFASGMDINSTLEYIAMSISDMTYARSPLSVSKPSDIKELQPTIGLHPGETDHVQIYITANIIHPGIITLPLALHIDNITEMPVRQEFDSKWDIFSKDDYYDFYDDSGVLFSVGGTDFVQDQLKNIELGDTLYIKTTKAGTMRIVLQINTVIAYKKRAPGEVTQAESKAGRSNSQSYYTGRIIFEQGIVTPSNGVWSSGNDDDGNIVEISLEDVGLSISGTPASGDTITQKLERYITPSRYLMPPVYRESLGAERFYNALNDTYTNPDTGEKYVFENVYDPAIPREHKQEFGDIKPTIKGMTNAAGQRMDQILDIAFDLDDNDEVDEEGKYLHPYFFVKLPKYNGDYGFNLFDHAIDEEEMSISMTSGQCGACEFIIGVSDDEAQRNLVQVDSSGNLLRDSDGNVRCGRKGMPEESPQDRQNDTMNYEVWIALKKEESTYGQIMPNAQQNLKPAQGDTFVILHIDLPQAYILNAENELKEAIIKYMAQNNSEKFNFSITFSRIYLEEHPDIESQLNENARVQVEYDGVKYEFYISQYTYKCLDEEALPEISVEITDTVTVNRTTLQNTADAIIKDMNDAVGNIDFLTQGLRYFIRKDVDDVALGTVTFRKGVLFGNFSSGLLGSGAAIQIDRNGSSHAEFDFLTVRRKAVFKELSIEEVTHAGGQIIVSPASMVCSEVEDVGDAYRCYFESEDDDGASVYNQFVPGDQARCQTFNMWGNRYYWRLVVETGRNYIDLSKTDADTGSDIPQAGDRIVQLGNRNDTTRQAAQIISCFGENSPSYVMYNGINSYSLAGKNITGIIYNQETAEPQMYSYGSFYFGDRDISASDATFITYQQREGETKKRLFIQADVQLGPGSSGLGNLDEWKEAQQNIQEAVQKAEDAADAAVEATEEAQKVIGALTQDGVITPLEKQALKNELARVKADYKDVQAGYGKYGLGNPTDYNLAYVEYTTVLQTLTAAEPENVPVPENFDTTQQTYYDRWTEALDAIAEAAKAVANDAKTAAQTAQDIAEQASDDAQDAQNRLDTWASDGYISPTEKPALKDEIARIDSDHDYINDSYTKYALGAPTSYNNIYSTYRSQLNSLTSTSTENISIPSTFRTNQTTYYTRRTEAMYAIAGAAKDAIDDIQYIKDVFPNNTVETGALISEMAVVKSGSSVLAGLNGTTSGQDSSHGKVLIFAGAGTGTLANKIATAKTRIYSDGHFVTSSADIAGKVTATSGKIGNFDISDWLTGSVDNVSVSLSPVKFDLINEGEDNYKSTFKVQAFPNIIAGSYSNSFIHASQEWTGSTSYNVQNACLYLRAEGAEFKWAPYENNGKGQVMGNFAVLAEKGMYGGLRPVTRVVSASGATYLSIYDFVIGAFSNSSTKIYLYLPDNPENGQYYRIIKPNNGVYSLRGGAKSIFRVGSGNIGNYFDISSGYHGVIDVVFVEDDNKWHLWAHTLQT